jgi:mRNA interferase MazF
MGKLTAYVPERGDLIWLDFDPQAGREQRKRRPALVLSPKAYNQKTSLAIVCPLTSKLKGYPFEVVLSKKPPSAVLSDQIKSVDWQARHARHISAIRPDHLKEVIDHITILIMD